MARPKLEMFLEFLRRVDELIFTQNELKRMPGNSKLIDNHLLTIFITIEGYLYLSKQYNMHDKEIDRILEAKITEDGRNLEENQFLHIFRRIRDKGCHYYNLDKRNLCLDLPGIRPSIRYLEKEILLYSRNHINYGLMAVIDAGFVESELFKSLIQHQSRILVYLQGF